MPTRRSSTRPGARSAANADLRSVLVGRDSPVEIRKQPGGISRTTGLTSLIASLSAVLAVALLARSLGF